MYIYVFYWLHLHHTDNTSISYASIISASSKHDGTGYKLKEARVKDALEGGTHGGTLVLADTKHQVINKACKGETCWCIL